jgi:hypothetical protein
VEAGRIGEIFSSIFEVRAYTRKIDEKSALILVKSAEIG